MDEDADFDIEEFKTVIEKPIKKATKKRPKKVTTKSAIVAPSTTGNIMGFIQKSVMVAVFPLLTTFLIKYIKNMFIPKEEEEVDDIADLPPILKEPQPQPQPLPSPPVRPVQKSFRENYIDVADSLDNSTFNISSTYL